MNILITGATSGIGFELAKLYQQTGQHKLVLLGRKALTDLPEDSLFNSSNYYQLDLSASYQDHQAQDRIGGLSSFLEIQTITHLDLVIHNAGMALYGPSNLHQDDTLESLINTNLLSPITLSHSLLPLIQASEGKLVFVSSVAAHIASADYAEYIASKAALEGFARSLRAENDVRVQVIRPGATKTDIFSKAGITTEQVNPKSFSSAESVAKAIYEAIKRSDLNTTIELSNKVLSFVGRFFAPVLDKILVQTAKRKQN